MVVHPKHTWVVAEPIAVDDVTAGGIYLPDTVSKTGNVECAVVESVGSRVKLIYVGDVIAYRTHAATTFDFGGVNKRMIQEENVMATVQIEVTESP